jgi:hypothetical protein
MQRFQGPAARGQYLTTLYRNDMQGADHLAFIGYLLQEVQKLSQRVMDLEAGFRPTPAPVADVCPPLSEPLAPLPVEVPAPPPTVPQAKPAKPAKPAAEKEPQPFDIGDLKHIVLDLPDEPPTKKRGQ